MLLVAQVKMPTSSYNLASYCIRTILLFEPIHVGDISFRYAQTLTSSKYFPTLREKLDKGEYDNFENKPIIVCDINPDMLSVGKDRAPGAVGATNANMVRR
jgi:hypothetical protein